MIGALVRGVQVPLGTLVITAEGALGNATEALFVLRPCALRR